MPRGFEGMPPPSKGKRGGAEMGKEDPSIYGKLDQLAGQQTDQMGGMDGMGGGGSDQQASQLIMQGAQMLMQAGQLSPQFKPLVDQVMGILAQGVRGMAGGGEMGVPGEGGGMEGRMKPPSTTKKKKPKKEDEGTMEEDQFSAY